MVNLNEDIYNKQIKYANCLSGDKLTEVAYANNEERSQRPVSEVEKWYTNRTSRVRELANRSHIYNSKFKDSFEEAICAIEERDIIEEEDELLEWELLNCIYEIEEICLIHREHARLINRAEELVKKHPEYKECLDRAIYLGEERGLQEIISRIEEGESIYINVAEELVKRHPKYREDLDKAVCTIKEKKCE